MVRATTWTKASGTFTAPAGAARVGFNFTWVAAASGPAFRIDDILIQDHVVAAAPTPKIRSATSYGVSTTGTSSTVPLPTTWLPGDLCYIGWSANGTSFDLTTPAGWSEVVPEFKSGANVSAGVLKRVLQAGDTDVVITHTNGRLTAISMAIYDHDASNPEDVASVTDANGGVVAPNVRAPSIDPVTDNCLLLTFHTARGAVAGEIPLSTPPPGMTQVDEMGSQSVSQGNSIIGVARLELTDHSSTGTKTGTTSGGAINSMLGSAIVVRSGIAEDFMILMTEAGYPLVQENRALLLLES